MSQYLKTVVMAVIGVSTLSVFFPEDSFGKYTNILSGFIVMAVLLTPILRDDVDFVSELPQTEELNISSGRYIMEEFEKELSGRIAEKLESETGEKFLVTVYADTEGEMINIKKVEITPYSERYAHIVSRYAGLEEGKITSG